MADHGNYRSRAAKQEGHPDAAALRLITPENTANIHNVIVCTLCSGYPRKGLAEFGLTLPKDTTVRIHDSTADMRYIVLPARPEGADGWSAEKLAALVTRDRMIGVGIPKSAA